MLGRHIFPNMINTLLIVVSLQVGGVILTEASLSFLGLGLPPDERPGELWFPRAAF